MAAILELLCSNYIVLMNNKISVSEQTYTTIHSVGVGEIGKPGTVHLYINFAQVCLNVYCICMYVQFVQVCLFIALLMLSFIHSIQYLHSKLLCSLCLADLSNLFLVFHRC